jgi:hypothetical protein
MGSEDVWKRLQLMISGPAQAPASEPKDDFSTRLLRATDSELECLIGGYLLQKRPVSIRGLHDHGSTLVGKEHMPTTKNGIRSYLDTTMNPSATLAEFVRVETSTDENKYALTDEGAYWLPALARYRLSQGLIHNVSVTDLFGSRRDPRSVCEYILCASEKEGVKSVQDLSDKTRLTIKQSSDLLHCLVAQGLAEETREKNGKGLRLALISNGPLSAYARTVKLTLDYLENPEDAAVGREVAQGAIPDRFLHERIARYTSATGRRWGYAPTVSGMP